MQQFLTGQDDKTIGATTAVSDVQTAGDTSDCSDLFVMDSSRIYWAIRRDWSVLPLQERFATQRLMGLIGFMRLDAVLTHPEAAMWLRGSSPRDQPVRLHRPAARLDRRDGL